MLEAQKLAADIKEELLLSEDKFSKLLLERDGLQAKSKETIFRLQTLQDTLADRDE